jgi:hypothetical protein
VQAAWRAAPHFQKALAVQPCHAVAAYSLVEVLATDPARAATAEHGIREVLALLDSGKADAYELWDALPFPPDFGLVRVEWERAAWRHAGDRAAEVAAKARLLRWRLHTLLGRLRQEEPEHHGRAAALLPDVPSSQAAHGCALARAGHLEQAEPLLRRELAANLLDAEAARAHFRLLRELGQHDDADRLAAQRRRLTRVAPHLVAAERLFDEPPAARRAGRARVSLCLIVRDEEHNLPDCLAGAADLVDEVIVVDTGSSDRTKEIAARFGAKVFDFPWVDSFAAARNETLRHATGEWVFWLDADDRLDEDNRQKLRTLFAGLGRDNACYSMKCLCLPDPQSGAATVVDHVRLFRNLPQVRWRYRVHEQILPAVRAAGGRVRWTDVVIAHTGYTDPALRRRKLQRDLRLLHLEDGEHPGDPFTLFNLGSVYQELARHAAKVRRYIVLHDTTTFGTHGEVEGQRGLWPAVEAFLARGTFRLKQRYENNNGLTVLEAVAPDTAGELTTATWAATA